MQLLWFHRVLIAVAVVFFLAFSAWSFARFLDGQGVASLIAALGALIAGTALTVYFVRLRQILKL